MNFHECFPNLSRTKNLTRFKVSPNCLPFCCATKITKDFLIYHGRFVTVYTTNSKGLERAWSRGIVDRIKEYSFVLSTMPRLHARSRLLELGEC